MTDDMIERVARAIYDKMTNGRRTEQIAAGLFAISECCLYARDRRTEQIAAGLFVISECRLYARAAIEAMREPTEAMRVAGGWTALIGQSDYLGHGGAERAWRQMIDAALEGK
jgi:uncharacterized protein YjeT (DUF2065 family)